MWYCDAYCDVMGSSYTKEIEVIIKVGKMSRFWRNQSDQLNPVTASANQYLSRGHVIDWEKACLE